MTTRAAHRPKLLDVACKQLGAGYTPRRVGRTLLAAGWTRENIIDALESGDPAWFERVTELAQANEAHRRIHDVGPLTFQGLSDAVIRDKAHPKLKRLLDTEVSGNVTILGPTGCGKSSVSFALLRSFMFRSEIAAIRRNPGYFESAHDQASQVDPQDPWRRGWVVAHELHAATLRHPLGEGTAPALRKAKDADLLVIDDLQTPARDDTTLEVLWYRYDRKLPTITTCGLTKARFLERFGDAFGRRLIESGGQRGFFVNCFEAAK